MNTPLAAIALCACVLSLSACEKKPVPTSIPTPTVNQTVSPQPGATTGSADPSVPSATSVYPAGGAGNAGATVARTDATRTPSQESKDKGAPMPGQNNDHSAPLASDKAASTP